ncbi:MAG: hypothetical protein J6T10_29000 [Methanobrevibacter sp.]|nr:hypothetical protein [Methanobrevibacter sp.]
MKNKKATSIFCPQCGREYLPCEIYLPDSFLGKSKNIMRYTDGTIEAFFGKSMDLKESYVCDKCGSEFEVSAKVTFKTFPKQDNRFREEYITKLNKLRFEED